MLALIRTSIWCIPPPPPQLAYVAGRYVANYLTILFVFCYVGTCRQFVRLFSHCQLASCRLVKHSATEWRVDRVNHILPYVACFQSSVHIYIVYSTLNYHMHAQGQPTQAWWSWKNNVTTPRVFWLPSLSPRINSSPPPTPKNYLEFDFNIHNKPLPEVDFILQK